MDFEQSLKGNNFFENNKQTQSSNSQAQQQNSNDTESRNQQKYLIQNVNSDFSKINTQEYNEFSKNQDIERNELTIHKNKKTKNIQNQNIESIKYFDSNKIGDLNEQDNQEMQYNNEIQIIDEDSQEYQKTLFKNKNTKVYYLYKFDSNQLIIRKIQNLTQDQLQNKSLIFEKELHQKECKILELLKGHDITLNIISQNQNNLSFEQTIGKCDLQTLNKKTKNKHLFETYFLVLLDKLNRMHQQGVAHSDIKPQNIVISYQNEPFFIDFDASVLLSDHDNYLQSHTPKYNLNVYLKQVKKHYQPKKFKNEEEIKLCDKTQLALTFLYLLCENKDQIDLFKKKDFNLLMSQLINAYSMNEKYLYENSNQFMNDNQNNNSMNINNNGQQNKDNEGIMSEDYSEFENEDQDKYAHRFVNNFVNEFGNPNFVYQDHGTSDNDEEDDQIQKNNIDNMIGAGINFLFSLLPKPMNNDRSKQTNEEKNESNNYNNSSSNNKTDEMNKDNKSSFMNLINDFANIFNSDFSKSMNEDNHKSMNDKKNNSKNKDDRNNKNSNNDDNNNKNMKENQSQYLMNENNSKKNRQIVISIISRILNQADPTIKVLGDYQQETFTINYQVIYTELNDSDDIVFDKMKNTYIVKKINKFSIQLLYLLDQMCCNIEIIPNNIKNKHLPEMKEYQHIYQNYKQIEEYYKCFQNGKSLISEIDINNFSKYIKRTENQKFYFKLTSRDMNYLFNCLKKSSYRNTHELNFSSGRQELGTSIKTLRKGLLDYDIEKYCFKDSFSIYFQMSKETSTNPKIKQAEFYLNSLDLIEKELEYFFSNIKNNYLVEQLIIIYPIKYYYRNISIDEIQEGLNYLAQIVKQMKNEYSYVLQVQIKQETLFEESHLKKLQQFQNIISNNNKNKKQYNFKDYDQARKYQTVNDFVQKLKENSRCKNQSDDEILYNIRRFECQEGENIATQVLLQDQQIPKKIVLKFYNFLFTDKMMWLEIIENIVSEGEQFIEVILVNCLFSNEVLDLFKEIQLIFSEKVKYEFNDEYNQNIDQEQNITLDEDVDENKLSFKFDIMYNQKICNQLKFKMKFFRRFAQFDQQIQYIQQDKESIQNQKQQYQNQIQNQDFKQVKSNSEGIQDFLSNDQLYKTLNLKELKVFEEDINSTISIQSKNKIGVDIDNKEDMILVLEELKNQIFYNFIKIRIDKNKFFYQKNNKNNTYKLKYYLDSNDEDIYHYFDNLINYSLQDNRILIEQNLIKDYESFIIDFTFKSMFQYYPEDMKQSQNISDYLNNIKLSHQFILKEQQQQSDKINDEILNRQLIDKLIDFQNYYCLILKDMQTLIKNNNCFLEFVFENQNLNDESFKFIYLEINKLYLCEQKAFNIHSCGVTKQTLQNIYEALNEKGDLQLNFEILENDISFLDFEQFVKQIIQDKPCIQFTFEIEKCHKKIQLILKQLFKNCIKFKDFRKYFTLEYLPQNQQSRKKVSMLFNFSQQHFFEYLNIQINEQMNNSVEKKISIKEFLNDDLYQHDDIKEIVEFNFPQFNQNEQKDITNQSENINNQISLFNYTDENNIYKEFQTQNNLYDKSTYYTSYKQLQEAIEYHVNKLYEQAAPHITHTNTHPQLLNYDEIIKEFEYKD